MSAHLPTVAQHNDHVRELIARLMQRPQSPTVAQRVARLRRCMILQRYIPEFNEADCGGVFDGVGTVYSDADPGL